jgi:predicted O-methyltransferase YrrM
MKNYSEITGFCNFEQLYADQVARSQPNEVFVEVGSLWGRSIILLAQLSKHYKKPLEIHSIDFWDYQGVPELMTPGLDPSGLDYIKDGPDCLYNAFLQNLKDCGVENDINHHRMSSEQGSTLFQDNSVDFIFIDAMHTYEAVSDDLNKWFPKLKSGKMIAGHDYDWEGVKKAVDEFFGVDNIYIHNTSWIYYKP